MKTNRYVTAALALALTGAMAGCKRDAQAPDTSGKPAAAASKGAAADAPAKTKVSPVTRQELQAGIDLMTPRMVATADGFRKVEASKGARVFMHPALDKAASIEFDSTGLTSVTLSPFMRDLGANDCAGNPEAGIVEVVVWVDGAERSRFTVDRNYAQLVDVGLSGSKRLKVDVNKGNDIINCDHFLLGIVKVVGS